MDMQLVNIVFIAGNTVIKFQKKEDMCQQNKSIFKKILKN